MRFLRTKQKNNVVLYKINGVDLSVLRIETNNELLYNIIYYFSEGAKNEKEFFGSSDACTHA